MYIDLKVLFWILGLLTLGIVIFLTVKQKEERDLEERNKEPKKNEPVFKIEPLPSRSLLDDVEPIPMQPRKMFGDTDED